MLLSDWAVLLCTGSPLIQTRWFQHSRWLQLAVHRKSKNSRAAASGALRAATPQHCDWECTGVRALQWCFPALVGKGALYDRFQGALQEFLGATESAVNWGNLHVQFPLGGRGIWQLLSSLSLKFLQFSTCCILMWQHFNKLPVYCVQIFNCIHDVQKGWVEVLTYAICTTSIETLWSFIPDTYLILCSSVLTTLIKRRYITRRKLSWLQFSLRENTGTPGLLSSLDLPAAFLCPTALFTMGKNNLRGSALNAFHIFSIYHGRFLQQQSCNSREFIKFIPMQSKI